MDEIARTAKVSRATLYLHFSGRESLVAALIEDQLGRFIAGVRREVEQFADLEDRLVYGFGHAFRALAHNRALSAVLAVNPRVLHPIIIGDSQALDLGRALVEAAMGNEDLPAECRSLFAEHVARMIHTYILIPTRIIEMAKPGVAEAFARQFLVPVLNALIESGRGKATDHAAV